MSSNSDGKLIGGSSSAAHSYDPQSGQTYREWVEPMPDSNLNSTNWNRQQVSLQGEGREGKSEKGARSFVDMLVKVISENVSTLEMSDLDEVPPHLALLIWKQMVKTQSQISLQSFMILSKIITKEQREHKQFWEVPKGLFKFRQTVKRASMPLTMYTTPLMNNPLDFIVHLTFAGNLIRFETHELLSLTQLKNLGVLEFRQPRPLADAAHFPRVNDSVLRHWSQQKDAFPLLRVLRIWGDYFTTKCSLQYVTVFPALQVYDVAGVSSDWYPYPNDPYWSLRFFAADFMNPISETFRFLSSVPTTGDCTRTYNLLRCLEASDDEGDGESESESDDEEECEVYLPPLWTKDRTDQKIKLIEGEAEAARLRSGELANPGKTLPYRIESAWRDKARRHFWGNVLYRQIGLFNENSDLVKQGMHDPKQSFVIEDEYLIPPRPYIEVNLGDYRDTDYSPRFHFFGSFTRFSSLSRKREASPSDSESPSGPKEPSQSDSKPKLRKKQKIFSLEDL
ncbi:hypothetical protein F4781DRAFT_431665 [Annulohypoxylon bovei var. microspora]|nr:hypothetical protein F4781DRAFT_431665 [Annulohypoxylon bovei var. microspora]